jgi:DNA invertase Pin-like site-specific DNA recombinase
MAWSVDRLGRSLQDLIGFLSELHSLGIDLALPQQGIDTTTPAGKAMFQMMGVFAEFERSMIVERVRAGVGRAKASGTKSGKAFGRPRVATESVTRWRLRGARASTRSLLSSAWRLGRCSESQPGRRWTHDDARYGRALAVYCALWLPRQAISRYNPKSGLVMLTFSSSGFDPEADY